jgi:2',3'-cyclic-nucleotide 2'-phosphodiesterase (5'-nucleotidase family)
MRNHRLLALVPALTIGLLAQGCARTEGLLWYTASLDGNLDGCTCVSHPRAGLVKRAAFLRTTPDRDRALLVDAGDLFDAGGDARLAAELLEVYGELGYDAIAVGDHEVALGGARLAALAARSPLLAHNLSLRSDLDPPPPLSAAPLIVEKSWGRIAIVALIDPSVLARYPPAILDSIRIASPEAAARLMLARLAADPTVLRVLLFHGPWEAADRLARAVAGFHLIVVGHDGALHEPLRIRGAVLVSPGEEGNRLGMLELAIARTAGGRPRLAGLANTVRLFSYRTDPDDPGVRQRIDDDRRALAVRTESDADVP